jgi:hypothetical protein
VTRTIAAVLGIWLAVLPAATRAEEADSPHYMAKPDGELDMEKCGVCHNEDLSLIQPKLDTCTLCHAATGHAGAAEHLRAVRASVKRMLEQSKESPALPLTEDGHIYCGTCHLFHDPSFTGESWLSQGWVPRTSGLPSAVREEVLARWKVLAAQAEGQSALGAFAASGTRQLRLPVDDGQLCRHCHGALR